MTHYKGRPLKAYSQEELVKIVVDQQIAFQELLKEYHANQMKTGRSIEELVKIVVDQQIAFQELLKEYHANQMKTGRSIIEQMRA